MAKRLNQLLAIEKGLKQQVQKDITELHRVSQKEELYDGLARNYEPLDEAGEKLPPESKIVQQKADAILSQLAELESKLIDVVAAKDLTNTQAVGDIEVAGLKIENVPATHLLWLEKQFEDLHTFISKLPTLDPSVLWHEDRSQNCMTTVPVQTHKSKKVPRNHVKAEATKEHPAQVEVYHEDVVVGNWTNIRYSGRLSVERKNELLERVRALQAAAKQAREKANMTEVVEKKIGARLMGWLFKGEA